MEVLDLAQNEMIPALMRINTDLHKPCFKAYFTPPLQVHVFAFRCE